MRPPFAYYGGKTTLASWIVDHLPTHRHYVEPFAGSLAVLLAKPPTTFETVNDLDGDLMTFWRMLRDHPEDLARVAAASVELQQEVDRLSAECEALRGAVAEERATTGHDVRLGCDRTECLLLIDPEDLRAALASPGEGE